MGFNSAFKGLNAYFGSIQCEQLSELKKKNVIYKLLEATGRS